VTAESGVGYEGGDRYLPDSSGQHGYRSTIDVRRGGTMDTYQAWFDLKPGVGDIAFHERLAAYLGYLRDNGLIEGWRLMRRKLGLGPASLGEFHLVIEAKDLAQLEAAFAHVATRAEPVESFHHAVNSQVTGIQFALYRDFPDRVRQHGQERF
jgi:hypothetical protein